MKKCKILFGIFVMSCFIVVPVSAANWSYSGTGISVNYSDNSSEVSVRSTVGLRQSTYYSACAAVNHGGFTYENCSNLVNNGKSAVYVWYTSQSAFDNHVHYILDINQSVSMIR